MPSLNSWNGKISRTYYARRSWSLGRRIPLFLTYDFYSFLDSDCSADSRSTAIQGAAECSTECSAWLGRRWDLVQLCGFKSCYLSSLWLCDLYFVQHTRHSSSLSRGRSASSSSVVYKRLLFVVAMRGLCGTLDLLESCLAPQLIVVNRYLQAPGCSFLLLVFCMICDCYFYAFWGTKHPEITNTQTLPNRVDFSYHCKLPAVLYVLSKWQLLETRSVEYKLIHQCTVEP